MHSKFIKTQQQQQQHRRKRHATSFFVCDVVVVVGGSLSSFSSSSSSSTYNLIVYESACNTHTHSHAKTIKQRFNGFYAIYIYM